MKPLKQKYGQTALYILLLTAAVFAMGYARRCSSGQQLPPLAQGGSGSDTIDVAIIYGPMSYYIYADTLGGLNYDLLRIFSKQSGRPIKMWPIVNLSDAMNRLDNGAYDMLVSLPSDNSIKKRFLTTQSVFLDRLVLIQLADTLGNVKVRSALDLANDSVYIQRDSPAGARLGNLANEIGAPISIIEESDLSEEYLCMKVASGDIPLAVVNEKIAKEMQKRYPRLSFDNPISFTQFQVWLINKNDSALLNATDSWLKDFRDSGSLHDVMKRYIP